LFLATFSGHPPYPSTTNNKVILRMVAQRAAPAGPYYFFRGLFVYYRFFCHSLLRIRTRFSGVLKKGAVSPEGIPGSSEEE
jgi:hypothetical protein